MALDLDSILDEELAQSVGTQQQQQGAVDELDALLGEELNKVKEKKGHYRGALLLQPQTRDLSTAEIEQIVDNLFEEEERRRRVLEEIEGLRSSVGGKAAKVGSAWLTGALETIGRSLTSAEMTPSKVISEKEAIAGVKRPFSLEKGIGTTIQAVLGAFKGDFSKFKNISFIEDEEARKKIERLYNTPLLDADGKVNLESLEYSALPREEQNRLLVLWAMQKTGINMRQPFEEILKAGGGYTPEEGVGSKALKTVYQMADAATFNVLSSQVGVKLLKNNAVKQILGKSKDVQIRRGSALLYTKQLVEDKGELYLIDEDLGAIPLGSKKDIADDKELARKAWEEYAKRVIGTVQAGGQVAAAQALDLATVASLGAAGVLKGTAGAVAKAAAKETATGVGRKALLKGAAAVEALGKVDEVLLVGNAAEKAANAMRAVSPKLGGAAAKALMADTKKAALARNLINTGARMTALGTYGYLGAPMGQEKEGAVGSALIGQTMHTGGALFANLVTKRTGIEGFQAAQQYNRLADMPAEERAKVLKIMERGGYVQDEGGFAQLKRDISKNLVDNTTIKKYFEDIKNSKITPQLAYDVITAIAKDPEFQENFARISTMMSSDGRGIFARHLDESARKVFEEMDYWIGQTAGKEAGTAQHAPRIYVMKKKLEEAREVFNSLPLDIKNSREKTLEWLSTEGVKVLGEELADNIKNTYLSADMNTLFFRPAVHEFARVILQDELRSGIIAADPTAANTVLFALSTEAGDKPVTKADVETFKQALEELSTFRVYPEGEPIGTSILRRAEKVEQQDTAPARTAQLIKEDLDEKAARIRELIRQKEDALAKRNFGLAEEIEENIREIARSSAIGKVLETGKKVVKEHTEAERELLRFDEAFAETANEYREGADVKYANAVRKLVKDLQENTETYKQYLSELTERKKELEARLEEAKQKDRELIDKQRQALAKDILALEEKKKAQEKEIETLKEELSNYDSIIKKHDSVYEEIRRLQAEIAETEDYLTLYKQDAKVGKKLEKEKIKAELAREKAEATYKELAARKPEELAELPEVQERLKGFLEKKKVAELKAEIDTLRENIAKAEKKLEGIDIKGAEEKKKAAEGYKQQLAELQEQLAAKQKEKEALDAKVSTIKQGIAGDEEEINSLKQKIGDIEKEIAESKIEDKRKLAGKRSLLTRYKKNIEKLEASIAEKQKELQAVTGDIDADIAKLEKQIRSLNRKISSADKAGRLKDSKVPIQLVQEAIAENKAELAKKEKKLIKLQKEIEAERGKYIEDVLAAYRKQSGEKLAEEMRLHKVLSSKYKAQKIIEDLDAKKDNLKELLKQAKLLATEADKNKVKRLATIATLAKKEQELASVEANIRDKKKHLSYVELFGSVEKLPQGLVESISHLDGQINILEKESMATYRKRYAERLQALYDANPLEVVNNIEGDWQVRVQDFIPITDRYLSGHDGIAKLLRDVNMALNGSPLEEGVMVKRQEIPPDLIAAIQYLTTKDAEENILLPYITESYNQTYAYKVLPIIKKELNRLTAMLIDTAGSAKGINDCIQDLKAAAEKIQPEKLDLVNAINKIEYLRDKFFVNELIADERAVEGHTAFLDKLYHKLLQGNSLLTAGDIVRIQNIIKDSALGKAFRVAVETEEGTRPEWLRTYSEDFIKAYEMLTKLDKTLIDRIVNGKVQEYIKYGILNSPDDFNAKIALGYFLHHNAKRGISGGKSIELLKYAEAAHLRSVSFLSPFETRDIKAARIERHYGFRIANAHRQIFGAINAANNYKLHLQETLIQELKKIQAVGHDEKGRIVRKSYVDCMYVSHPVQQFMLKNLVAVRGHDNMPTIFTDFLRDGYHEGMTFVRTKASNIKSGLAPELTKDFEVGYVTTHLIVDGELTAMGKLYFNWLLTGEDSRTFANRVVRDLRSSMDDALHIPGIREEVETHRDNLARFIANTLDFYGKIAQVDAKLALDALRAIKKMDAENLEVLNSTILSINKKYGLSIPKISYNPWRLETDVSTVNASIVVDPTVAHNWKQIDSWMGNRYRTSPEGQTLKSLTYNLYPHYITDLAEEIVVNRLTKLLTEYLQKPHTLEIQNAARFLEDTGYAQVAREMEDYFLNPSMLVGRPITHYLISALKTSDMPRLTFGLGYVWRLSQNIMLMLTAFPSIAFLQPVQSAIQMFTNRPTKDALTLAYKNIISGVKTYIDGLPKSLKAPILTYTSLERGAPNIDADVCSRVYEHYVNRSSPAAEMYFNNFGKITGFEKIMRFADLAIVARSALYWMKERSEARFVENAIWLGNEHWKKIMALPEEERYGAIRKLLGAFVTQGDALQIAETLKKDPTEAQYMFVHAYVGANLGYWGSEVELPYFIRALNRIIPGVATFFQAATINLYRNTEAIRKIASKYTTEEDKMYAALALMAASTAAVGIGALSAASGIDMFHTLSPIPAVTYVAGSDEEALDRLGNVFSGIAMLPTKPGGVNLAAITSFVTNMLSAISDEVIADDPELVLSHNVESKRREAAIMRKLVASAIQVLPVAGIPKTIGLTPREFAELFFTGLVLDLDAQDRAAMMENVTNSVLQMLKEQQEETAFGTLEELNSFKRVVEAWKMFYIEMLSHPEELQKLINETIEAAEMAGFDSHEARKMVLSKLKANPYFNNYYEALRESITRSKERTQLEEKVEAGEYETRLDNQEEMEDNKNRK